MKTLITVWNSNLKHLIFSHEAIERLEAFTEVHWVEEGKIYGVEQLVEDISKYDACITSWGSPKFTSAVLENARNLKFIGHAAGTVVPMVDESVFDTDIAVVNANSALARSTAEYTLALMHAGVWNLAGNSQRLKEGNWADNNSEKLMGLYGQTVGLIGCGEISREVIRLLQPYHPKIRMFSSYCSKEEADTLGVELCSLEELLKSCNIVSLHNTLTPTTKGMLGKKELELIRDGALLVNTARGPIIQEEALVEELKKQRFHAAFDVYAHEPLPKDNILLKLPNVLCTPHIGGFCSHWKTRLGLLVVEDLERFIKGKALEGCITGEKFKRLTPA